MSRVSDGRSESSSFRCGCTSAHIPSLNCALRELSFCSSLAAASNICCSSASGAAAAAAAAAAFGPAPPLPLPLLEAAEDAVEEEDWVAPFALDLMELLYCCFEEEEEEDE